VAVEARRASTVTSHQSEVSAPVLPLPRPVPPAVTEPAVERALPSVAAYDDLLTRRPPVQSITTPETTTQGEAV
jgi:hypothetical protein